MSSASACARAATWARGATKRRQPPSASSRPFSSRPVYSISRASGPPNASSSTAVEPMPGVNPSAVKFAPYRLSSAKKAASHQRPTSRPPPTACPAMAATVGSGKASRRSGRADA